MEKKYSFTNWTLGILATIIAGLAIWWITKPEPKEKVVDIKVLKYDFDFPKLDKKNYPNGQRLRANYEIYNEGNKTAENCKLYLVDGSSKSFGLGPNSKDSFELESMRFYKKKGRYTLKVWIECDGYKQTLTQQEWFMKAEYKMSNTKVIR